MGIVRWKGSGSGGGTVHFCRRARQARARGANCDSNPLPRGAAEPGARSRPRAPARARRAGVIWNRIAALCNPGWAAARRTGYRLGLGGCFFFFFPPAIGGGRWREREERWWERREGSRRAARRGGGGGRGEEGGGEGRAGRGGPGAARREGPRGAGAGAGGVGGGRVGGERESNSRTRPERPARIEH